MITTYIALGSNLQDPIAQLEQALRALAQLPQSQLNKISPFYQNPAVGPPQPDFINAVAELQTLLSPPDLLQALQHIEQQQGRVRTPTRNAPRTLDLDIVLYGNQVIDEPLLTVPHPRLYARAFVLIPLYDIHPHLIFPNGHALAYYYHLINQKDLLQCTIIKSAFSL